MKKFLYVVSLVILSACSARIHDGDKVIYDEGGRVDLYEELAKKPKEISGTCMSACTIFLSTGCVKPEAILVFHPPGFTSKQPYEVHLYWAKRIASHYPPEIQQWYFSNWSETRDMNGTEAILKGARQC
jgi:hypothetical protein